MKQRILQKFMMMAIAMLFGSISPAMAEEYVYELTNQFTPGGEYLIVNKNSTGTRYALRRDGTSIKDDEVSINQPGNVANNLYIDDSDVDANSVWTVGSDYSLKNNGYYLYGDPAGILNPSYGYLEADQNNSQAWEWDSSNNRLYYNYKWTNLIGQHKNKNLYIKAEDKKSWGTIVGCNFSLSEDYNSVYLYKKVLKKVIFSATPQNLTFNCDLSQSVSKTITVNGSQLRGNVTWELEDPSGVFSVSPNSLTPTNTTNRTITNGTFTVTFHPTTLGGPYNGTVTLKTDGTDNIVVNLSATVNTPSLTVTPQELEMEARPNTQVTATFDVSGQHIHGNGVTLTLSGDAVFTISRDGSNYSNSITLTKAQAEAEGGVKITVKYSPTANQDYTGKVTISTQGVSDKEVTLNGYSTGYLVTIGSAGATTLYVDMPLIVPSNDIYPGLKVWYAKGITDKEGGKKQLSLISMDDNIPANTGVVIIGAQDDYYFMKYRDDDVLSPISDNILSGTTTGAKRKDVLDEAPAGSIVMTLSMLNRQLGFYKYTGENLAANKAYLIYQPAAGSNVTYFSFGDESGVETDDISNVKIVGAADSWYTLQGARLNGQPTQRGIYIHGGKKVIVK